MVSFRKLFLATSLFLSGVAAAPAIQGTELHVLEKRVDPPKSTTDANHICEQQFVTKSTIQGNGNSATVVDLSGCTAFFFYSGNTHNYAAHIFCGNIASDGASIAATAEELGADSCIITAFADYNDASKKACTDAGLTVNAESVVYDTNDITPTPAVTYMASSTTKTLTRGIANRVCT